MDDRSTAAPAADATARTESAQAIADVLRGFREGRAASVRQVGRWVGAVVHGGNWRFPDPEGVVQEVLVRLVRIVREDRIREPGGFQKFVHSTAKYTCLKLYFRERKRSEREVTAHPEIEPADPDARGPDLERRERMEGLRYVLQRLPESCRELWRLVYGDGLPAEQVADRLSITVNNLRVRVHRCTRKARELYRAWERKGVER